MTNEEIRDALIAACEGSAFVDVADEGTFILDGAFTLQQLVEIGDAARKGLGQQGLSDALTKAIEQFGAERLAKALVEPKAGDTVRAVVDGGGYYSVGDYAKLIGGGGEHDVWLADFNDPRNARVKDDGIWAISDKRFEVVR